MALDGDFTNFRAVYDDLTGEVMRARYQFLPDHLRNWFKALDTTPSVAFVVSNLEAGLDITDWMKGAMETKTGMGNGRLIWPDEREKALGTKLLLFRQFAAEKQDIANFGFYFVNVGRNLNDNARAFIDQVFAPMARDLRRYLERQLSEVPAADRVVRLDHNCSGYQELINALDRLEATLRGANDYQDADEKDQRVAEVSASIRLLQAAQIRIGTITELLRPVLVQFAAKVKDNLIALAAAAVTGAIIALFGHIF